MKRNPLAANLAQHISDKLVRMPQPDTRGDGFTFSVGDEDYTIKVESSKKRNVNVTPPTMIHKIEKN